MSSRPDWQTGTEKSAFWAADMRHTVEGSLRVALWHLPSQYTSITTMANTWSIDEMTHGGKWPSFIDKRQWVDFKENYHNRIALRARMGYTMSSPIWRLCSFMFSRFPASTRAVRLRLSFHSSLNWEAFRGVGIWPFSLHRVHVPCFEHYLFPLSHCARPA